MKAPHHEAEIRTLTEPLLSQSQLAGSALEALRADIWNLYRQQGRLASIDISALARSAAEGGNVLQVQVQRVNVEVQGGGPVNEGVIDSILADVRDAVPEGSVLDLDRLDSTIKFRQFLGDASLYAVLVPVGEAALDINLQVGLAIAPPTTWVAQYYNYGMSTYGRDRYTKSGGKSHHSIINRWKEVKIFENLSNSLINN